MAITDTKQTSEFLSTYRYDKPADYSYPIDVTTSKNYGGNFVVFHINVQSQSKLAQNESNIVAKAVTGLNSNFGNISATSVAVAQGTKGFFAGGTAGAVFTELTGNSGGAGKLTTSGEFSGLTKIAAAAVSAATLKAGAVGLVDYASGGFSRPVKRLLTAIALYMPPQVSTTYGVNYSETEMPMSFLAVQAIANAASGSNPVKDAMDVLKYGGAAKLLSNGGAVNDAQSKLSKLASNPTTEMIFKSVDTRTFSFTYRFAPQTENEAQNVLDIIKAFKIHMHPEFKDATSFLYIYPSEFDIVYYSGGTENMNIHRHTSCVLTNMTVNYSPNGVFSTFDNGMPTQIEVSLTFKELAKLDRDKIDTGKY